MHKVLLLPILLLATNQSAKAMFLDLESERHASKLIQFDPKWDLGSLRGKLPREITIVDSQTPINDELLAKLNPEWQKLSHTLTLDEKNGLLDISFQYPGGDNNNYIRRCLLAEAIAIGADPSINATLLQCTALAFATLRNDCELVKYVMTKLTQEQIMSEQIAFPYTKSSQIAELLFHAHVPMPEDILFKCLLHERPVELMKLYLQKGANPNCCRYDSSVLSSCAFGYDRVKYVPLLLDAGADINFRNENGRTIFHLALFGHRANPELCEGVVDYFLKQEKIAIISFLGCLRKKQPHFYSVAKPLRPTLFRCFSLLAKLEEALEIKDKSGQTAYQIEPLEIVNPANCTYLKLKQLRRKPVFAL